MCVCAWRKDLNKVVDRYVADLDRIVTRAGDVLTEEFNDVERMTRCRDQFVAQIQQHETAIQHKASRLKFLIDLHANELLETIGDVRDAGLQRHDAVKHDMEKCCQLTDSFKEYATEVIIIYLLQIVIDNNCSNECFFIIVMLLLALY